MKARFIVWRQKSIVASVFQKKTEDTSCLRFRLENFVTTNSNARVFAASRIKAYRESQALLIDDRRSPIRANGLRAVFYSRFYCVRGLILTERYDTLGEASDSVRKIRELLQTVGSSDHKFKSIISQLLENLVESNETIDQIAKKDLFKEAVTEYFSRDERAVGTFLRFEREIWKLIPSNRDPFLVDEFAALNQETIEWAETILRPDIQRTRKGKDRLYASLKVNKIILAVLLQPVIG